MKEKGWTNKGITFSLNKEDYWSSVNESVYIKHHSTLSK